MIFNSPIQPHSAFFNRNKCCFGCFLMKGVSQELKRVVLQGITKVSQWMIKFPPDETSLMDKAKIVIDKGK